MHILTDTTATFIPELIWDTCGVDGALVDRMAAYRIQSTV